MPDSLLSDLSHRVESFLAATGISQRKLARLIKTDESHLSSFLAGRSGLSAEKSLKLLQILNCSRQQLERKFGRAEKSARIAHFQQQGQPMQLDSGGSWVPGQSGEDPVGSGDITTPKLGGDPSGDALIDVLRQVDNYHAQAREAIAGFIAVAQKAKVNDGPTSPPKRITDLRKAGPRGDLLP